MLVIYFIYKSSRDPYKVNSQIKRYALIPYFKLFAHTEPGTEYYLLVYKIFKAPESI